ncbi:MAG: hypothetical protein ACI4JW_06790 [Oscillospiraceae bacterium]
MDKKFEYTYSAPQNAEIERIRKKYEPKTNTESKLEQIKRLDKSVETEGMACSLALGIIGTLVFGFGMCCTMVWTDLFILGIIAGIIGMIMCGCAYPLYKDTVNKKRAEIAPQILKLSEEYEKDVQK